MCVGVHSSRFRIDPSTGEIEREKKSIFFPDRHELSALSLIRCKLRPDLKNNMIVDIGQRFMGTRDYFCLHQTHEVTQFSLSTLIGGRVNYTQYITQYSEAYERAHCTHM